LAYLVDVLYHMPPKHPALHTCNAHKCFYGNTI